MANLDEYVGDLLDIMRENGERITVVAMADSVREQTEEFDHLTDGELADQVEYYLPAGTPRK